MTTTPAQALCRLHARLIGDEAQAFDYGWPPKPTQAGRAWLKDYARYNSLWAELECDGSNVPELLRKRFGFVIEELDEPA